MFFLHCAPILTMSNMKRRISLRNEIIASLCVVHQFLSFHIPSSILACGQYCTSSNLIKSSRSSGLQFLPIGQRFNIPTRNSMNVPLFGITHHMN